MKIGIWARSSASRDAEAAVELPVDHQEAANEAISEKLEVDVQYNEP